MRVSPCRSLFVVRVMMVVGVALAMMVVIMVMVMIVVVVRVAMVRVIVMARRHRGADGGGTVERMQERQEARPFTHSNLTPMRMMSE